MHPVPRVCANKKCQQVFFITKPSLIKKRKYCSVSCSRQDPDRRSCSMHPVPRVCSNEKCGQIFFITKPSLLNKRRYCSSSCKCEDSKCRAKQSVASKKMWQDPKHKAKMSAASKKMWQDPDRRFSQSVAALYSSLCKDIVKHMGMEDELKRLAKLLIEQEMKDDKYKTKAEEQHRTLTT